MVKKKKKANRFKHINLITPFIIALLGGLGVTVIVTTSQNGIEVKIDYSSEKVITGDEGEYVEEIPTIEEIDGGGQFKDSMNVGNGEPELYYELGSIEQVDTSSPEAFKRSTLGRCIVANNYYGAQ